MKRLLIILANCLTVLAVAAGVLLYAESSAKNSAAVSRGQFEDTTAILEEIASNYLVDSQEVADRWAALINGSSCTMEVATAMLQTASLEDGVSVQLLWSDSLTGLATRGKAADPTDHTVDYSKKLAEVPSTNWESGSIHMTPRYNDPQTGSYVVAFCSSIRLKTGTGETKDGILLYVMPVKLLEARWTFPTEYGQTAEVALIDSTGKYIIKPDGMKNEDFFNYVYSYNKGSIGESELREEMNAESSGSFEALNARGENCYFVYAHLKNNEEWTLVSMIPSDALVSSTIDWNISILLVVALSALLLLDVGYLFQERRIERKTQENINRQTEIIAALAENYSNVFIVNPDENTAEIIKAEAHVTTQLKDDAKSFPISVAAENYARERVLTDDRASFLEQLTPQKLREDFAEAESSDYTYRVADGQDTHFYNMHIVRISKDNESVRLVVGFRNIDTIIAEQDKNRKLLEDALNAAQYANRAKTVFLNNMSHDIRTPMNAISALLRWRRRILMTQIL